MPVDQALHRSLVSRCVFDARYYDGSIQDRSPNRIGMTFVGDPVWSRINGLPCLRQSAVLDGTASGNIPRFVDVTGSMSVEWCGVPEAGFAAQTVLLSHVGGVSGGFAFVWDAVNAVYSLILYDAAGAMARSISTPGASAVPQNDSHVIITSSAGGTVGTASVRGVPVAVALGGAGVAANINASAKVSAAGAASGLIASFVARAWPSVLTPEERGVAYQQMKTLTGGEV